MQANLVDTIILLVWYTAYIVFLAYNATLMGMIFGDEEEEEGAPTVATTEANPASEMPEMPMTPTMGDNTLREGTPDVTQDAPAAEDKVRSHCCAVAVGTV